MTSASRKLLNTMLPPGLAALAVGLAIGYLARIRLARIRHRIPYEVL